MAIFIYNITVFLGVTLSQFGKTFDLPATLVGLVPNFNTSPYSHRFKSLICSKTLVEWIIPNLYHLLIYSSSLLVQFQWIGLTLKVELRPKNFLKLSEKATTTYLPLVWLGSYWSTTWFLPNNVTILIGYLI